MRDLKRNRLVGRVVVLPEGCASNTTGSIFAVSALQTAAMGDPMLVLSEGEEAPTPCGAVHFYLALRAADIFNVEHSRWPGSGNKEEDPDGSKDLDECLHCAERVLRTCTGDETATVDESLEMAVKEM